MNLVLLTVLCVFSSALGAVSTPLIEAEGGHDVILQCPANPGPDVDLSKSSVTWSKDEETNIVHVYTRGQDRAYDQKEEFRNRTSLNHESLRKGTVLLRLSSLRLSDSGRYICYIRMLKTYYYIDLKVVQKGQLIKPQGTSPNMMTKAETPVVENGTGHDVKYTVIPIVCVLRAVLLLVFDVPDL